MCLPSVIVRLTLNMAAVILTAAGLGFLGLGAQPPLPEWGAMIATGRRYMLDHWWLVTFPGLAIMLVSLAFNLFGDGLRDVLDPRRTCLSRTHPSWRSTACASAIPAAGVRSTPCATCRSTVGREKVGIVGESGSGKSTIGRALLKLLPTAAHHRPRHDASRASDLAGRSRSATCWRSAAGASR